MPVDLDRLDRILPSVQKPGRYTGGEFNSIAKDWGATSTHICLAFPDIYDLGMSNLGMAILYDLLNAERDVLAERAFAPWVDMNMAMREARIPLYSLESKRPLADFDIIGFSLPYEQLYTNLLEMLDLAGLPLRADERDEQLPLIIAGGHAVFNPEPMADFVDAFVIGDGEEATVDVVRVFDENRTAPKEVQLRALARVSGVYVPRFYGVEYNANLTVAGFATCVPEAQLPVFKRVVSVLPTPPLRPIVPLVDVSHNRATVELQRGCTRGCRFCQAGIVTRPVRERPTEEVLEAVRIILGSTGFDEVGLLSLSSSDYTGIGRLVQALAGRFDREHLSISLPALRADSFSIGLAEAVSRGRRTGFTFAPEAASERLCGTINKPISAEQVLGAARELAERGWRTVKLYFMIGLPGERMEDVLAIADLVHSVRSVGRGVHGRRAQVNVSVNTFVPKPHTPLQWAPLEAKAAVDEKQALLRRALRRRGIKLTYVEPDAAILEAALARGDRRLGRVVQRAWELGTRFDAWDEQRDMSAWMRAFRDVGLEPDFYANRERPVDEVLPWDVISTGVSKRFLAEEYERSQSAETRADCRAGCHHCGILSTYGDHRSETWRCP
jgi:radical SAM family uncharacterized protein